MNHKSILSIAAALVVCAGLSHEATAQVQGERPFIEQAARWPKALPHADQAKGSSDDQFPISRPTGRNASAHQARSWLWLFPQDLDAAKAACGDYAASLTALNTGANNPSVRFFPGSCVLGRNADGQNTVSLDVEVASSAGAERVDSSWTFATAGECENGHEALLFLNNDTIHAWSACFPQKDGSYELDEILDIAKLSAL